jgi:GMP synthase-like glutamine amidotransferase
MIGILYHAAHENAGLILSVLKNEELKFKEYHLYHNDLVPKSDNLNALVIMGGPMNVDEIKKYPYLAKEVTLIQEMIKQKKPVLGICLGSQLIAKALGSKVYPNKTKEVGWHPIELSMNGIMDDLFKEVPNNTVVLHWHGDTFDLPKGATHLASTEKCQNQAFKYGENVYALQFHLEATPALAQTWAEMDENYVRAAHEDPDEIIEKGPEVFADLKPIATNFIKNFLSFSKTPAKR